MFPAWLPMVRLRYSVKIMVFDRGGIARCACCSDGRRGAGGVGASGGHSEAMVIYIVSLRRVAVAHDTSHRHFWGVSANVVGVVRRLNQQSSTYGQYGA